MSKNVAVFVDVANIFYAAKAAGVDIDYVTLLKAASAGRDLVRAYAYTGLDPDNENQRNFHDFLRRSNYKVVSKDIRKYGDGKVKANLDIELVVDMMKTARNLDIAIVVSGDGDFAPAIRAVQEQGVRVEVISFRGNTSSDLIEVADQFTDIVQLARVEKGSRSGRRVADGDDLSMTEVPDKQTEGTGAGRGRGRPRGRGRDAEPVAASDTRSRGRGRLTPVGGAERIEPAATGTVVALPGERLSRVAGSLTEADLAKAEVFTLDDLDADVAPSEAAGEPANGAAPLDEDGEPRRRRRRGGRGRGRGRGREDGALEGDAEPEAAVARAVTPQISAAEAEEAELDAEEDEIEAAMSAAAATAAPAAPRGPRTTPFGSVWDSQLGTPTTPAARTGPAPAPLEDEDFDEPEIPEYLIAEQRRNAQGGGGGGRGVRGGRAAYQSAVSRERYGGGRGGGGINRYPDVSGRSQVQQDRPPRDDRNYQRGGGDRPAPRTPAASAQRSGSNEPWSDVPPELEAMLRAQVAAKPSAKPAPSPVPASTASAEPVTGAPDAVTATGRPRSARASTSRAPRTPRASSTEAAETTAAAAAGSDTGSEAAPAPKARAAAKPRTTTRKTATAASGTADDAAPATAPAAAAKPRATRKPAAAAATAASADAAGAADGEAAAPKRRTTRKTATTDPT